MDFRQTLATFLKKAKTRYHGTLFAHKVQVWNTYRDIIYELTS